MFYTVTGFLYRNENFKEEELIEINKEFRHENPEKARENAFKYAKSIIEVLLESINVPYQNEKQAEKALVNFHTSNIIEEHPGIPSITYNNDVGKLITVAYSTSKKPDIITKSGLVFYDSYEIIYGFGYDSKSMKKMITKNLKTETEILKNEAIHKMNEFLLKKEFESWLVLTAKIAPNSAKSYLSCISSVNKIIKLKNKNDSLFFAIQKKYKENDITGIETLINLVIKKLSNKKGDVLFNRSLKTLQNYKRALFRYLEFLIQRTIVENKTGVEQDEIKIKGFF